MGMLLPKYCKKILGTGGPTVAAARCLYNVCPWPQATWNFGFPHKYADDATLLSPHRTTRHRLNFRWLTSWIGQVRTKWPWICSRPWKLSFTDLMSVMTCFHVLLPPIMHSVSRVAVAKLLGVHLRHDLNFSQVESVVATCNQRLSISTT